MTGSTGRARPVRGHEGDLVAGTDADLVAAARRRAPGAVDELYRRYGDAIHAYCRRRLPDMQEAEDAAQDTFVAALEHIGDLREPERLRSWLYTIAARTVIRRSVRRRRDVPVGDPEVLDLFGTAGPADEPGTPAVPTGHQVVLRTATSGLTWEDTAVLQLHLLGVENSELAAALSIRAGAAAVRVHRAKTRLRESVDAVTVSRRGRSCPDLDELLRRSGWDGGMTPLLRKRIARHTRSCPRCAGLLRRLATPPVVTAVATPRCRGRDRDPAVTAGRRVAVQGTGSDGPPRPRERAGPPSVEHPQAEPRRAAARRTVGVRGALAARVQTTGALPAPSSSPGGTMSSPQSQRSAQPGQPPAGPSGHDGSAQVPGWTPPMPPGHGPAGAHPDPYGAHGGSRAGGGFAGAHPAAFAPWPRRALSMLIDGLPPSVALFVTNNVVMSATTLVGVLLTLVVGYLGSLAFVIWNAGYLQGTTGQSLGRRVAGTRLVRLADGRNTGFGLALGRIFAHIADGPLCLGYLWPLWDERRQTFADKICGTVVVPVDR